MYVKWLDHGIFNDPSMIVRMYIKQYMTVFPSNKGQGLALHYIVTPIYMQMWYCPGKQKANGPEIYLSTAAGCRIILPFDLPVIIDQYLIFPKLHKLGDCLVIDSGIL